MYSLGSSSAAAAWADAQLHMFTRGREAVDQYLKKEWYKSLYSLGSGSAAAAGADAHVHPGSWGGGPVPKKGNTDTNIK